MIRRAATFAFVALILSAAPTAAIKDVAIASEAGGFQPRTVNAGLGEAVAWQNDDDVDHTSSGRRPLSLWNRYIAAGGSRAVNFQQAGTFPYLCTIHPSMTGKVRVPMTASTASVGVGGSVVLRMATPSAASGFRYQVGRRARAASGSSGARRRRSRRHGSPRRAPWVTGSSRTRTVRISNGGRSSWSPPIDVEVIP